MICHSIDVDLDQVKNPPLIACNIYFSYFNNVKKLLTCLLLLITLNAIARKSNKGIYDKICNGETIHCKTGVHIQSSDLIHAFNNSHKAIRLDGDTIEGDIDLYNLQVDIPMQFTHCIFTGRVLFDYATIKNMLIFNNCVFKNTFKGRNFFINALEIRQSRFERSFDISDGSIKEYAHIGQDTFTNAFAADGTIFQRSVSFARSCFKSDASFVDLSCGGQANFDNCRFDDAAHFGQMHATGFTHFDKVSFRKVQFIGAAFNYSLEFTNCHFADTAIFNSSAIDNVLNIKNCVFDAWLSMVFLKVGNIFYFRNDTITVAQPFCIKNASLKSLTVDSSVFKGTVDMWHAQLTGGLIFTNADVSQKALLREISVASSAELGGTTFRDSLILINANLHSVNFTKTMFPAYYDISGMTYTEIISGRGKQGDKHNLDIIRSAVFNISNYKTLESIYRQAGNDDFADDVYVRGQRERANQNNILSQAGNTISRWVIYNGKKPLGALWLSFAIIAVSALVFRKKDWMELSDPVKDANQPYYPLLYSLDLFIPFVDLRYKNIWRPKPASRFRYIYMRAHTFLGWIIVPWLIAYWTGLVK